MCNPPTLATLATVVSSGCILGGCFGVLITDEGVSGKVSAERPDKAKYEVEKKFALSPNRVANLHLPLYLTRTTMASSRPSMFHSGCSKFKQWSVLYNPRSYPNKHRHGWPLRTTWRTHTSPSATANSRCQEIVATSRQRQRYRGFKARSRKDDSLHEVLPLRASA